MDGEEFFDALYRQFYIHFPCYAVILTKGQGFATEPAADGTSSLVLLTDDDLADQYLAGAADRQFRATLDSANLLAKIIDRLPPSITHITFDPTPRFHRRYSIGVIRERLAQLPVKKAG